MATKRRVEVRRAVAFAEIAEALNLRTDQIAAVLQEPDEPLRVVYSPWDDAELWDETDAPAMLAVLARDSEGILRLVGSPVEMPGLWERLRAGIDARG